MELSLTLLLILFKNLLSSKNKGGEEIFSFSQSRLGKNFFIAPPLFFKMEIIFIYRIKKNILGRRI